MKGFSLTLLLALAISSNALAQNNSDTISRVGRYLEASGYNYSKLNAAAWSIGFKGDHNDDIDVILIANGNNLIVVSIIADKAALDTNAPALRALLKINGTLPAHVDVLLDNDDDYVVQSQYVARDLNNTSFKKVVEEIALASDSAYGAVKSFLKAPGSASSAPAADSRATPSSSTTTVEVLNGRAAVSYNPAKWKETKTDGNRREFARTDGDAFAAMIFERIEIPTAQLPKVALTNARQIAPDVKLVEEQPRKINGKDVLLLRMEGTADGVKFTFFGYYFGGPQGTIQLVTWTSQNLFNELRPELESFLDGLNLK